MGKGGGKGQIYDVDNGINERMLDVRETRAHTKDNDSYVYRAEDTKFIYLLEKAVLALFGKSRKERPRATCGGSGRDREQTFSRARVVIIACQYQDRGYTLVLYEGECGSVFSMDADESDWETGYVP